VRVAQAVARSGLIRFYWPDQLARIGTGLVRLGLSPAAGPLVGRTLWPDDVGLVDEHGGLTFHELDAACDAAAAALLATGLRPGDRLGLWARNGRGFYLTMVGAARAGIDVCYLNTGFTPAQAGEVVTAERLALLVVDGDLADDVPTGIARMPLPDLVQAALTSRPVGPLHPHRQSQHVILTSGTTGRARGVARSGGGVDAVAALLGGFPLRVHERHLVAAPAFHAWGWLHLLLTMLLGSTVVTVGRFDPRRVLDVLVAERCEVLVAVPTMLRQLVDEAAGLPRPDALRLVAVSGSALSGSLSAEVMDAFGDVLYNLYGSTEVAFATVAGPGDLRAAPGTAGRPLPGVRVRVVDERGRPVPAGRPGEVVVGSGTAFSGYTSGEDRRRTGGGVHVGDLGWFDDEGRLFVGGRVDDLVVTGGENVYPLVVEHALDLHPDVVESAVVGEPDETHGQVLVAHVRLRPGATVAAAELRRWAAERVARHEVPRRVVVHHGPLPRNPTGKVTTRHLPRGR
jgi:acyl-CoA synthetase (AMP-forming)/AMP-acid ligase II